MLPRKEIYLDGVLYMTRYYLCHVWGYDIVLHRMSQPDADERLHTHPWRRAYSFVLKGSYLEERLIGLDALRGAIVGTRRVRWFNSFPPVGAHRIIGLYSRRFGAGLCKDVSGGGRTFKFNVWTVFFMGQRVQKWGFMDRVYTGWRPDTAMREPGRPYIRAAIQLHPYDRAPRGNTHVKHYGNCRLWKEDVT